MRESVASA